MDLCCSRMLNNILQRFLDYPEQENFLHFFHKNSFTQYFKFNLKAVCFGKLGNFMLDRFYNTFIQDKVGI